MRRTVVVLAMALLSQCGAAAVAQQQAERTLVLPRPLHAGEIAWLDVRIGVIGRGQIHITTASGQDIGTLSNFGVRAGQEGGTQSVPIPPGAIQNDRVTVRITISEAGATRAPTAEEVPDVTLHVTAR